jgi:nicotinamidase-related amidase
VVVRKPRVSAFYGTDLESVTRTRKIDRVVLAGVSTAWVVQATARDVHDHDYEVFVVEDARAASNQIEHDESIRLLNRISKKWRTWQHNSRALLVECRHHWHPQSTAARFAR